MMKAIGLVLLTVVQWRLCSPLVPSFIINQRIKQHARQRCVLESHASRWASLKDFDRQFERWQYLQQVLDGETAIERDYEILLDVLSRYQASHESIYEMSEAERYVSPELTPQRQEALTRVFELSRRGSRTLSDDSNEVDRVLEQLLPDPVEDEYAATSNWETIEALHGTDIVKVNEKQGLPTWKQRCLLARLLIHHDFLTIDFNKCE